VIAILAYNYPSGRLKANEMRLMIREHVVICDTQNLRDRLMGTEHVICLLLDDWLMGPGWNQANSWSIETILTFLKTRKATLWLEHRSKI
jgi:hypothetical protein